MNGFDAARFRQQFPALSGDDIYLDSAATALKPQAMIDASTACYRAAGTVHRSQHSQARKLTAAYEHTRQQVAELLNAQSASQIIWTRGTTESINLVAHSWLSHQLQAGDEILVSEMEHHANLIPWLMVAAEKGARVVKWPVTAEGLPRNDLLPQLLTGKTRLLAISQMSNVTGALPALSDIIATAHAAGVRVLVDGAQGIVHQPADVTALQADFYAFSGHKLYGPTGVGVLYASTECLAEMKPWMGGGKMVDQVSFDGFSAMAPPHGLEAGTPNIAGVCAFGATLDFLATVDHRAAALWSESLATDAEQQLAELPGFRSLRQHNAPLLSFSIGGIHPSDMVTLLAEQNIAIRAGQHCAQPLMKALDIQGCLRASFAPYNNQQDVDAFVRAVRMAHDLLSE
ncbi:MAG: cysteine desulfurase CsdA [Pseudomonadota bacterium]